MKKARTFLRPLLAALAVVAVIPAAQAADYACRQTGDIAAMPPLIPKPIHLDECTAFSGPQALEVGKAWCAQATNGTLGPSAPPVVKVVASCAPGAVGICRMNMGGGAVKIERHFYVADAGTGGIANLRKTCEASAPGAPAGVFVTP
ncbi:hypothetical protein [Derxia gummosa]|uniref:Secreted protein n=1 Tax=Derxia gummosa DSM 723 TaxID=1121388 RepID=A0A8B6X2B1_9BURK|nr:hypothetical protein [Derxia gummosa]